MECLRRYDAFPADYKDEYLERYEYHRERKIAIMALLGIMDPRRPSKDIESKRRRQGDGQKSGKKDSRYLESEKRFHKDKENQKGTWKEEKSHNLNKNTSFKDNRTSSNNPFPKSALYMEQGGTVEDYEPEAVIRNLRHPEEDERISVLYDTGSQVNLIHPQLVKDLGLRVKEQPQSFATAAGKVSISKVTEDFLVKIKLIDEATDRIKWYEYETRCRLADAIPRTIVLGSKFMDQHLVYRKLDPKDYKPKVYKMKSKQQVMVNMVTADHDNNSIYMVQTIENKDLTDEQILRLVREMLQDQTYKNLLSKLMQQFNQRKENKDTITPRRRYCYSFSSTRGFY